MCEARVPCMAIMVWSGDVRNPPGCFVLRHQAWACESRETNSFCVYFIHLAQYRDLCLVERGRRCAWVYDCVVRCGFCHTLNHTVALPGREQDFLYRNLPTHPLTPDKNTSVNKSARLISSTTTTPVHPCKFEPTHSCKALRF